MKNKPVTTSFINQFIAARQKLRTTYLRSSRFSWCVHLACAIGARQVGVDRIPLFYAQRLRFLATARRGALSRRWMNEIRGSSARVCVRAWVSRTHMRARRIWWMNERTSDARISASASSRCVPATHAEFAMCIARRNKIRARIRPLLSFVSHATLNIPGEHASCTIITYCRNCIFVSKPRW